MRKPRYSVIEKFLGETPLQALERFRVTDPAFHKLPMTYAGRLDPMANGMLLILIGDECKKKDRYTKLDKEYEFEVLFGISSDTGDVLGLSEISPKKVFLKEKDFRGVSKKVRGVLTLPYPVYSSKTVQGKPLFQHAHDETLKDVEIPKNTTRVYSLRYRGREKVSSSKLLSRIDKRIDALQVESDKESPGSDFRVSEVLARWRGLKTEPNKEYVVAKFTAIVSSGTYIRSLAPLIAEKLGTTGLALSINRTKIGRYQHIGKYLGFWINKY